MYSHFMAILFPLSGRVEDLSSAFGKPAQSGWGKAAETAPKQLSHTFVGNFVEGLRRENP